MNRSHSPCGQLPQASPKPLACQQDDEGSISPGEFGTLGLSLEETHRRPFVFVVWTMKLYLRLMQAARLLGG